VEPRLLTAQSLTLSNDLHVQGSANIEDSLTIGSGFALAPGGITVDVATHTGMSFSCRMFMLCVYEHYDQLYFISYVQIALLR